MRGERGRRVIFVALCALLLVLMLLEGFVYTRGNRDND
jgi:hypothetical protein